MDVLAWLWWIVSTLLGVVWSIAWFLLGGWVVTLAQLAILVGGVFVYKYGWQRAPVELAQRLSMVGRMILAWVRTRELAMPPRTAPAPRYKADRAVRQQRQIGDINLSTLMSVAAILGLGLVAIA